MSKHGDMRVCWCPQIPCDAFHVSVKTLKEALLTLDTLARYDLFLFKHGIRTDYCNAGGLEVFDRLNKTDSASGSWVTWRDEHDREIDELSEDEIEDIAKAEGRQ